jgi:peroxiredoxin
VLRNKRIYAGKAAHKSFQAFAAENGIERAMFIFDAREKLRHFVRAVVARKSHDANAKNIHFGIFYFDVFN